MKQNKWIFPLILACFWACFVFLQKPGILHPTVHHNQGHILMLTSLKIWNQDGILKHHAVPVLSWPKEGDKFASEYVRLESKEGNNYFVSFPPLAFWIAYPLSVIFGCNELMLRVLALLCVFISSVFIFRIAGRLPVLKERPNISGLSAAFVFLFFFPLLFHSTSYFPGLLMMPLWLGFSNYILRSKEIKSFDPGIMIWSFLLFLTDWSSILIISGILLFLHKSKTRKFISSLIPSGVLAFGIIFLLFSSISGTEAWLRSLGIRFLERSGWFGAEYSDQALWFFNPESWKLFGQRFLESLWGSGFLFLFVMLFSIKKKNKIGFNPIFCLFLLPALLQFLIIFNSSIIHLGHWIILAPAISFGTVLFVKHIIESLPEVDHYVNITGIISLSVLLIITSYAGQKRFMERYPSSHDAYYTGAKIRTTAEPDQTIFLDFKSDISHPTGLISLMAERNIIPVSNEYQAKKIMKEKGFKQGLLVTFDSEIGYLYFTPIEKEE